MPRSTVLCLALAVLTACGSRGSPADEAVPDTAPTPSSAVPALPEAGPDSVLGVVPGEADDPAILDARDAEEFAQRQRSMESEASCLAKAAGIPDAEARTRVEAACRRKAPAP